jgi:hypothetical protein
MKRWIVLLTTLACGAFSAHAQEAKPADKDAKPAAQETKGSSVSLMAARNTYSGYIAADPDKTSAAQKFYDRKALLRAARFDPTEDMSKTPTVMRTPAEGNAYVILSIQLWDRRKTSKENTSASSLGKHDYILRAGGKEYPCLAIAPEGEPFDERMTEIRFKPGGSNVVIMIFEVPVDTAKVEFVPRFPQMLQEDAEAKPQEISLGPDSNVKKKGAAAKPAASAAAKGGCDSPDDLIATGIRLLEAKDYAGFFRSCMPPAMVKEMDKDGKFEMAAAMTGAMLAPALVTAMNELKGKTPQYNADKTQATFDDAQKTVMLKIDGRWYIDAK